MEQKQLSTAFLRWHFQLFHGMSSMRAFVRGKKNHAHTSCLHPKTKARSELRQNTGLWSQEGSMESLLHLCPSRTLPDRPPPELERNEACVNVYRANQGSTSVGMRVVGQELWISTCFVSLLIFPVHLHNALHSLGQFLHSHKVVLLLHGLQKLGQLLKTEKNQLNTNLWQYEHG